MEEIITPKPYTAIIKTTLIVLLIIAASIVFLNKIISNEMLLYGNIGIAILGIIYCFIKYIAMKFERITIMDSGIRYTRGILSKKEYIFPYSKISETSFHQSFFERIVGCGTIKVDTPGGSEMAMVVREIAASDGRKVLEKVNVKQR